MLTHRAPRSAGYVKGNDIVCGYHAPQFGPDGRCTRVATQPATSQARTRFGLRVCHATTATEKMVARDPRGHGYPEITVLCDQAGLGARRLLQRSLEGDR